MSESGPAVQARVQLLLDPDLHPVLYVSDRVVGLVLVGPERHPGPGLARSDHTADNGHTDIGHQLFATAGQLHEGHRRVDGSVSDVCVRCAARVRSGQLRVPE